LQRIATVTERLSIEINVTGEHLKSGAFEINPGHYCMKKRDCPGKNETNGNPNMKGGGLDII
jgi:hypothetical protein